MAQMRHPGSGLRVLLIEGASNGAYELPCLLASSGHQVAITRSLREGLVEISRQSFDLAFLAIHNGVREELDAIPHFLIERPWLRLIAVTESSSREVAFEAVRRGASDYLLSPFVPEQVELLTRKVAAVRSLEQQVRGLQETLCTSNPDAFLSDCDAILGPSIPMARQAARSDAAVLIQGEPGCAKVLLGRAIHEWSGRAGGPFQVAACDAAAAEAEDRLFGAWRDSRDDARIEAGHVSLCEGGTLLLEEAGDLPLAVQPKLARLIHDKEYERTGDFTPRRADVRVIATSSKDLRAAVRRGAFREDLFFGLSVIQIDVPPLRERRHDIGPLAVHYLNFYSRQNHRTVTGFTPDALEAICQYPWPGNVREVRNLIERAVMVCRGPQIGIEDLPSVLVTAHSALAVGDPVALETIEEMHIRSVLASTRSLEAAASILGINAATLWRRRKRYGI